MKKMTNNQLKKLRDILAPHLAEAPPAGSVDHPFHTLQTLLDPVRLSTKAGFLALSDTLYRVRGLTVSRALA